MYSQRRTYGTLEYFIDKHVDSSIDARNQQNIRSLFIYRVINWWNFQKHTYKIHATCKSTVLLPRYHVAQIAYLQSFAKYLGLLGKSLKFWNHKSSSFFNCVVENGGVSTGEFQ